MSETDRILAEIDAAKARFEANVASLAGGLPPGDELVEQAKRFAAIGGAGAAAVGVVTGVLKARAARQRRERKLDQAAKALARNFDGIMPIEVKVPKQGTSPLTVLSVLAAVGALAVGAMNLKKLQDLG